MHNTGKVSPFDSSTGRPRKISVARKTDMSVSNNGLTRKSDVRLSQTVPVSFSTGPTNSIEEEVRVC